MSEQFSRGSSERKSKNNSFNTRETTKVNLIEIIYCCDC